MYAWESEVPPRFGVPETAKITFRYLKATLAHVHTTRDWKIFFTLDKNHQISCHCIRNLILSDTLLWDIQFHWSLSRTLRISSISWFAVRHKASPCSSLFSQEIVAAVPTFRYISLLLSHPDAVRFILVQYYWFAIRNAYSDYVWCLLKGLCQWGEECFVYASSGVGSIPWGGGSYLPRFL